MLRLRESEAGVLSAKRRAVIDRTARFPSWLTAAAVYAVLTVLCSAAAYWLIFSHFALYDDEGYFDYTLKLFSSGHPLYSAVFSEYGPFYYELFRGVFAVFGLSITTDAGRLIQLVIWIAASLGLGLTAHRLTGRLTLGVAAMATSFALMTNLTNEPMHPEALICALLTATAAVAAFGLDRWPRASFFALGALAGALLLTKINVGGYAVIAIAFATVMAGSSLFGRVPLRRLVIVAFVLVGPAVMIKKLNTGWTRAYALLAALSALSLVFVASSPPSAADDESLRWPVWIACGFGALLVIVLSIVFLLGSSPGALFDEVVRVPTRQASAFTTPTVLGGKVVWWSLALAAAAWVLRRAGRTDSSVIAAPSVWSGLFRAGAGIAILFSVVNQFPFAIAPTAPFALAVPLAWVAALPSGRDAPVARARLVRLLIPSLAVLQSLVAYPVAGSQQTLGAILLVLCGAICLADGGFELVQWNREHPAHGPIAVAGVQALFVALAVGAAFQLVVQPLQTYHDAYRAGSPVRIAGATRLHLPRPLANAFATAVSELRTHCRTVISLPGMYSFNVWSRLPTPSPLVVEPFWAQLSSSQQRTVLVAAQASPDLCLVRNDVQALAWGGHPPPRVPLVAYLEDDFVPILRLGPYLVETRRPGAPGP